MIVSNLCLNVQIAFAQDSNLAFPGAEGGGMFSHGARASDNTSIYHVINLNDSGTGSFRDAVSKSDRIIVFDVAGTVMLESDLKSSASNITILGQTAPGEGICIGGASVQFSGGSNIIIRYMRFRSGDYSGSQEDGLGFRSCTDVILDHCSISWSVDECLSAYENKNFTAQYCIISESLNNSIHGKGAHGYGGIWGGINASFHHNLISTHNSRNPRIGTSATVHSYNDTPDYESLIDIRNNVIYNWGSNSGYGGENNVRGNFVNNYYKPTSCSRVHRIYEHYFGLDNEGTTLHLSGNVMEGDDAVTKDNWTGVSVYNDNPVIWTKCESISDGYTDNDGKLWANDQYIYDYPVTTQTAEAAYNTVILNAGASLVRDDIDKRVVDNVKNGTMPTGSKSGLGLIDSQNDVEGYITLYGSKAVDTDNDGIPDDWEDNNGLDKNNHNDGVAISDSGYTNLEEYANYLASQPVYEIDKAALRKAIKTANDLDRTHFGANTDFSALDNAIEQGVALLSSKTATQAQVNECAELINNILNNFSEDFGWKLIEVIAESEQINKWDYTADSYKELENAIASGDVVLNTNYTEADINEAIELINNAKSGLIKSLRRNLKSTIRKCRGVGNIGYYTWCMDNMKNEVSKAEELYNAFYVSEEGYAAAIERLNNAYDNLQGNFKEVVKFKEDFENGTGVLKLTSNCVANWYNDTNGNEGGHCFLGRRWFDKSGSNGFSIPSTVDAIASGSSVVLSEDVCFESNNTDANLLRLGIYNPDDKNKIPTYISIWVEGDRFIASAGKQYKSDIEAEANRWYNISMFLNNENKTVSFYVDGQPIAENIPLEEQWNGIFYNRVSMTIYNNSEGIYIDNLIITERIYNRSDNIYGDADYDGKLTSADAAYVLQKVLDSSFIMPVEKNVEDYMSIVDVNFDGVLASDDAAMILQKVLNPDYVMPVETTTETTTEMTTETTTETTTEKPTENTTHIINSILDFEDVDGSLDSPYTKDVFTIENSNGKIDIADVDIFNYKKAILLDENTITINVPESMDLEIKAKTTGDSDAFINILEGMLIIPGGDDVSANIEVPKGTYTIRGSNVYIASLKIYKTINLDNTTTETSTESTTETTTETTTNFGIEFDFSDLENGTYTTDFTNGIFSLNAGEGTYDIGGINEKYITLNSQEFSPNATEGYILIDADDMPNGFALNLEAILQGYSYGRISLTNETGEVIDMCEFYDNSEKTKATLNAYTSGKYTIKVSSGMPVEIYKIVVQKNKQRFRG